MGQRLALEIPPEWDAIDRVREQFISCLTEAQESRPVVDSIAMVACELLENAIKYGTFDAGQQVGVALEVTDTAITVEVRNPTADENLPQLNRLDRTIQWIRGYQDPFEAYLARLKEVSLQSPESADSGLGLVRIAYEGESALDFFLGESGDLAVSAVYQR
jgi:hypothetical protein